MAHLLTWTRIRLLARPSTIYSRYRQGKHHFRWLLRWRNLPVRASPLSFPLLRLTAYLRLASCLSTPGWMCIGIEYRQAAALAVSLILLLFLATASFRSLFLPAPAPKLFPFSSPTSSATAASSSKSSASSYESCDLIDRIASLPLDLSRLHSLALSLSLFLSSLLSFYNCPRFSPFLSRAFIPSMSCDAITTVSLVS